MNEVKQRCYRALGIAVPVIAVLAALIDSTSLCGLAVLVLYVRQEVFTSMLQDALASADENFVKLRDYTRLSAIEIVAWVGGRR